MLGLLPSVQSHSGLVQNFDDDDARQREAEREEEEEERQRKEREDATPVGELIEL